MNDGIRHLLEYATEQRAIGREATSTELHSIAEVIDCEMVADYAGRLQLKED